ncbi:MAG: class F sortase [Oscillochloridaceae bacterium umkhey_bin13]
MQQDKQQHRTITLRTLLMALIVGGIGLILSQPRSAVAANERCFSVTGYCISGEIRQLWERSGGLPVFGYPITPLQEEVIEGRTVQVQWFERARLELHPELAWPYRVQLGRVGVELLGRQGRPIELNPNGTPQPGCRFFPETGRNLCGELLTAWRATGLDLDGRSGFSEAENLALFGLPLSDAQEEMIEGRPYLVQWFERARLELHPELPAGRRVLGGLLGNELGPRPTANRQFNLNRPVQLNIPALGLNAPLVAVGLDAQAVPIVPKHDVGWYSLSAAPGEGENIVLWGHVLRWTDAPQIPAPFARVKTLPIGARITVTTRGGEVHTYVVRQQIWARPEEVSHILPQGREQLTLVSCIGDQVIQDGEVTDMSHRLITVALPLGR